jgi:hypothetical protein
VAWERTPFVSIVHFQGRHVLILDAACMPGDFKPPVTGSYSGSIITLATTNKHMGLKPRLAGLAHGNFDNEL